MASDPALSRLRRQQGIAAETKHTQQQQQQQQAGVQKVWCENWQSSLEQHHKEAHGSSSKHSKQPQVGSIGNVKLAGTDTANTASERPTDGTHSIKATGARHSPTKGAVSNSRGSIVSSLYASFEAAVGSFIRSADKPRSPQASKSKAGVTKKSCSPATARQGGVAITARSAAGFLTAREGNLQGAASSSLKLSPTYSSLKQLRSRWQLCWR
jgi:hypothetical protein